MKKTTAIILALVLVFALALPAAAAEPTAKSVDLYYRSIKVEIFGEQMIPQDATGAAVEPFIIDGTTYLPLRAVATALGLGVEWDDATSTVALTSGGDADPGSGKASLHEAKVSADIYYRGIVITLDGEKLALTDANGAAVEPFIYNGTTYLPLRAVATALGLDVDWDGDTSTVILGGEYTMWLLASSVRKDKDGATLSAERYVYDADGNTVQYTFTDVDGTETTSFYTYDARGNMTVAEMSDGDITEYTYNSRDLRTRAVTTSPNGDVNTTIWTYDSRGNCLKCVWADSAGNEGSSVYTYDAAGNCVKETYTSSYGDVSSYTYTYDANGNLIKSLSEGDGMEPITTTYTYTAAGMIATLTTEYWYATNASTYAYDADGLLIKQETVTTATAEGYSSGKSTENWAYDSHGNVTSYKSYSEYGGCIYTSGRTVAYTYDDAGRITRMAGSTVYNNDGDTDRSSYTETYTYDANGNMLTDSYISGSGEASYYIYTYIAVTVA